jgi:CRISPR-associated protein Cas1
MRSEDLGVLILDHPAISFTQAALVTCWEAHVVVVICDGKHLPSAILLPMQSHSLHSKILQQQIAVTEPTRKRLWRQIVRAKIDAQANVLKSLTENDAPLLQFARRVRSGDPKNFEAQAARIYWRRLFGEDFRRDQNGDGINTLLNYGYAILRAAVARALSGAGLHPALGLHHRNQYNSFCLADDVMEPMRPLVDIRVHELWKEFGEDLDVTRETKARLLDVMNWPLIYGDSKFPTLIALRYYAASLRRVLAGEDRDLTVPRL